VDSGIHSESNGGQLSIVNSSRSSGWFEVSSHGCQLFALCFWFVLPQNYENCDQKCVKFRFVGHRRLWKICFLHLSVIRHSVCVVVGDYNDGSFWTCRSMSSAPWRIIGDAVNCWTTGIMEEVPWSWVTRCSAIFHSQHVSRTRNRRRFSPKLCLIQASVYRHCCFCMLKCVFPFVPNSGVLIQCCRIAVWKLIYYFTQLRSQCHCSTVNTDSYATDSRMINNGDFSVSSSCAWNWLQTEFELPCCSSTFRNNWVKLISCLHSGDK